MGLNANFLRAMLPNVTPGLGIGNAKNDVAKKDDNTKLDPEKIFPAKEDEKVDKTEADTKNDETISGIVSQNMEDTFLYFNIYDQVAGLLKDFRSECLEKMKANTDNRLFSAESTFKSIYNKILNNVVQKAVERKKSGEKLDYSQIAQEVKDQVTAKLEECDYSSYKYFAQ